MQWLVSMSARLWLLLAPAFFLGGCAENDLSVVIQGNFEPTGDCLPQTTAGTLRPQGRLDIGLASLLNAGYYMYPRILNQLPTSITALGPVEPMGAIEKNSVSVTGFDVEIIADPGQPITDKLPPGMPGYTRFYVQQYGGKLLPGATYTGPVEVFSANAATDLLNQRVVKPGPSSATEPYQTVTVKLRGRALHTNGRTLLTPWIEFPLELCAFCLALKPGTMLSGYNPATGGLLECPAPDFTGRVIANCAPQQDLVSTCCIKDRQLLCGDDIPRGKTM